MTVFAGTDNIRDAWWPFGDGDMLGVARTIAYQSGFRDDDDLAVALDLATDAAARALQIDGYGLSPGAPADLLVVDARSAAEAVAADAPRAVVRSGELLESGPDPRWPSRGSLSTPCTHAAESEARVGTPPRTPSAPLPTSPRS
ncbi:hypothetical protein GCM10025864_18690 [Luteimicrobium album]|uniref:Amidohydrolase 3 domain-containing protein n=1 Tax=Luteimicrobium album TaxID=1054550 RepID=A0ABQ6I0E4_9MICO|nr:amidohydrolase family protein [Luteimicrobium album]GMA24110.1 hypothetical protein GCM10025864_18690 [Luteimicrobium album]